ncbi:MAG TPA: ABC transporter ATP-binding protein [Bacillota bacterium]|nr:ABC transporter ATP-binding protein [Bacillota bacterium]
MMMGGGHWGLHQAAQIDERAPFNWRAFTRLLGYTRHQQRHLVKGILTSLLVTAMTLVGPYLIKVAVDQDIAGRDIHGLLVVAGLYLGSRIIAWGANALQILEVNRMGTAAVYDLRRDLFAQWQRLGMRYFARHPAGVLISRGTNDITALANLVSQGIVQILSDMVTLVGIIVLLAVLDWRLALATLTLMPVLAAIALLFQKRASVAFRRVRNTVAELAANLQESFSGVRVTQAFAQEEETARRFDETNQANVTANMGAALINSLFAPAVNLINTCGTLIILAYGGFRVVDGLMTIGVLIAFLNYLSRFFQPIQDLTMQYSLIQQASAAAEKIFGILDEPPEVADAPDAQPMPVIQGAVAFEDVSFAYKSGVPVLQDVSFAVPPGTRVALVGPTGAGKTTIVSMLSRLYDPDRGSVMVDGIDLRSVQQRSYRRQLAMVPQDAFLFSGTVRENIRYGRPEATDEDIDAAVRALDAQAFFGSLPRGYDTDVGEMGSHLSQGQRQLVAFARALLANPRILVLDEATASVDSATEHRLQVALEVLLQGRTSFIIAHRLATIRSADVIFVVDDGRIVESGRHEELLVKDGVYAALHRRQFSQSAPTAGARPPIRRLATEAGE